MLLLIISDILPMDIKHKNLKGFNLFSYYKKKGGGLKIHFVQA